MVTKDTDGNVTGEGRPDIDFSGAAEDCSYLR
jgi:hypothetical protein